MCDFITVIQIIVMLTNVFKPIERVLFQFQHEKN